MRIPLLTVWLLSGLLASPAAAQLGYFGQNKVQYREFEWQVLRGEFDRFVIIIDTDNFAHFICTDFLSASIFALNEKRRISRFPGDDLRSNRGRGGRSFTCGQ